MSARTRLSPTPPDARDRREYWHLYYLANQERKRRYNAAYYRKHGSKRRRSQSSPPAPARRPRPRGASALQRRLMACL